MIAVTVLLLQGLLGFGLVRRLQPEAAGFRLAALALLMGLPASSVLLFLMELARIPILSLFYFAMLFLVAVAVNLGRPFPVPRLRKHALPPKPSLHEIMFLLLIFLLLAESIWKGIFVPGLPRDAIVGMDLVAKAAVEEGTIRSSVFTGPELAGKLSNQPFYAPFVMLMQVIFRLAGEPLGKVWPSVLLVSFTVFLYGWIRERLHSVFAGLLTVFFLTVPILHSYSYFVITDFANALFFGLAVVYLHRYLGEPPGTRGVHDLITASLFMAAVAWSRSESVLLVPYGAAVLLFARERPMRRIRDAAIFTVPPLAAFALWHGLYFTLYLGVAPENQFLATLMSPGDFLNLAQTLWTQLTDHTLYGSLAFVFVLVLAVDLIVFRSVRGLSMVGWLPFLFLVFLFVVHHFPAASVELTAKRGFMKLFPVMIFYMAQSRSLESLTMKLRAWEGRG